MVSDHLMSERHACCLDELEAGVHNYISYYNHERIKLALQGVCPVEYRLRNTA